MNILRYCTLKTLFFNFHHFPLKTALRFPVLVGRHVKLFSTKGSVHIEGPIRPGMIKIGFDFVGIYYPQTTPAIWHNKGKVVFRGDAMIKYGVSISVEEGAELSFGKRFRISCNSAIVCAQKIDFGDDNRVSWESTFMDTDFHKILSLDDHRLLNPDLSIHLGDRVWVGMHCRILKGATIGNDCVIAANTLVNKPIPGNNQIIAGQPGAVVKSGIYWSN